MRVSLIATVLNEGGNMRPFLDGLLSQTLSPTEIVIVDGGSSDRTVETIREYVEKGDPIRLLQDPGANIAAGRNLAVAAASGDIIASTDAGCRADPGWLSEIVAPLLSDPTADVACGISLAEAHSRTQEGIGILMLYDATKVDISTFSPSSRSVAFRKSIWEEVGGYPEDLYCAEDTLFNQKMRKAGARFVLCPKAIVYWNPPATFRQAARTFFRYAVGDGRARLCRGMYATMFAKAALVLALGLLGFMLPAFWAILALGMPTYCLRTLRVNRNRADAATNFLVFLYRIPLDTVRLAGYLVGRFFRPAARDAGI